jgi:hypothetical protein
MNTERFQEDRTARPIIVHDRPPAWTRLELAVIDPIRPMD